GRLSAVILPSHQLVGNITHVSDEKLGYWTECSVLYGNDRNRLPRFGKLNGQCPEPRMLDRRAHQEAGQGGEKAPRADQTFTQWQGKREHRRGWDCKASCAKGLRNQRAMRTIERMQ